MNRCCCCWVVLVISMLASDAPAAEAPGDVQIKEVSPDGKFALRAGRTDGDMAIVQKATGKVVQKLEWKGNPWASDAKLVWSADSQRVVYLMPWRRGVDWEVYFRKGNAFEEIKLPDGMPHAVLPATTGGGANGTYFKSWGSTKVKAWLKSGDLVIEDSEEDERDLRDEVTVTITFDKKHVAHVVKTEAAVSHFLAEGDNREFLDGRHDLAIKAYNRALEVDPKSVEAYVKRGGAKESKGDLDGALADYDRALKMDPKNVDARFRRANARMAKGDVEGAMADETVIIESEPKSAYWAYLERGGDFYAKREWARALSDFRSPITLDMNDGGHAPILVWLARVKLGEKEAADKELEAFLDGKKFEDFELDGKLAGYVLGRVTEEEVLKAAADSGAKTYPECEAWFLIGFKAALAGDRKRAGEAYEKCLAATKEKLPPHYWMPPEGRLVRQELKALGEAR